MKSYLSLFIFLLFGVSGYSSETFFNVIIDQQPYYPSLIPINNRILAVSTQKFPNDGDLVQAMVFNESLLSLQDTPRILIKSDVPLQWAFSPIKSGNSTFLCYERSGSIRIPVT